jgi:hypothetical protein
MVSASLPPIRRMILDETNNESNGEVQIALASTITNQKMCYESELAAYLLRRCVGKK